MDSYEIEKVVREVFNDSGSDELSQLLIYYITPGVFKNTKREMLEYLLRDKIEDINRSIKWGLEHNGMDVVPFGTEEEKKFVAFLIDECIFQTEKYAGFAVKVVKFGGGLFKSMMGMGMEHTSYYIMFKSLKLAVSKYFTAIYLYKKSINESEEIAQRVYKYSYLESLGL